MSENGKEEAVVQAPLNPAPNITNMIMTPFDHGVAAMERQLLDLGVPADFLARVMMQHAASIISLVEPAGVRAQYMRTLIENFPHMVRVAREAAVTTPGGVILPKADLSNRQAQATR